MKIKTKILTAATLLLAATSLQAQQKSEEPKFGINFSGFVKTDFFYDTRQNVSIREGHFLLYPENELTDHQGNDINAKPAFNILSIQSRLKGAITGPDAFGAKTSGEIEADFFGNAGQGLDDVNGFRLRHAFVKLSWSNTELLAGQYWHPMFVAESFPGVVSFNTGAPFQPFARNPQLRISHRAGDFKLIGVVFSQRDFTSMGNDYTLSNGKYIATASSGSKFIRNAAIPNLHFQVQYTPGKESKTLLGAGIDYKTILPETTTINTGATHRFESSETLAALSAIAYAKVVFKPITIKIMGTYAQNATDLVMLGGYAVERVTDTSTGAKAFTNFNTGAVWLDAQTNGTRIKAGLFAGYTWNMGTDHHLQTSTLYARGANIDHVIRLAPRMVFSSGKFDLAVEMEYTAAAYGKMVANSKANLTDLKTVGNLRGLVAFVYKY